MPTPPQIEVPAGMVVVENQDGSYTVTRSATLLSKTIAFRLPAAGYADLLPFLQTFPQRSWASAFRWLLEQPEVRDVIRERMTTVTRKRQS